MLSYVVSKWALICWQENPQQINCVKSASYLQLLDSSGSSMQRWSQQMANRLLAGCRSRLPGETLTRANFSGWHICLCRRVTVIAVEFRRTDVKYKMVITAERTIRAWGMTHGHSAVELSCLGVSLLASSHIQSKEQDVTLWDHYNDNLLYKYFLHNTINEIYLVQCLICRSLFLKIPFFWKFFKCCPCLTGVSLNIKFSKTEI